MSKIVGVTVGTSLPKPNWEQNDPTKGDYIKNRPGVVTYTEQNLTDEQKEQARANIGITGTGVPIMSETAAGVAKVGDNLKIDGEGRLSVDTADDVDGDNTRPITAAAVYATVGNIEVLLGTI